jgi:uncharacterized protein YegP (UPF0339 family)
MANIEFYQDESDKKDWRWRVKASNGQNIGKSSEGYSSRSAAENNVQFYQDESDKKDWRWRVWAGNGQQIGASEEGFSRKENAQSNLENLIEAIKEWETSES